MGFVHRCSSHLPCRHCRHHERTEAGITESWFTRYLLDLLILITYPFDFVGLPLRNDGCSLKVPAFGRRGATILGRYIPSVACLVSPEATCHRNHSFLQKNKSIN